MNIFFLDVNPYIAAEYHCDRHVIKMILEGCQLLSTAHRLLDGKLGKLSDFSDDGFRNEKGIMLLDGEKLKRKGNGYKIIKQKACIATHQNHPMAIWVRESSDNYHWQLKLVKGLVAEHLLRYHDHDASKTHKTFKEYGEFLNDAPNNIQGVGFTTPPQCMPDEYKTEDVVQAYRNYYNGGKAVIAKWKNRRQPEWFKEKE